MRRVEKRSEHTAWLLLRVCDTGRSHLQWACSGPCEGADSAAVTQAWAWLLAAAAQAVVRDTEAGMLPGKARCDVETEGHLSTRRGGKRSEHTAWLLLRVHDTGCSHLQMQCSGPCEGAALVGRAGLR
jgi:hypothetical protein